MIKTAIPNYRKRQTHTNATFWILQYSAVYQMYTIIQVIESKFEEKKVRSAVF